MAITDKQMYANSSEVDYIREQYRKLWRRPMCGQPGVIHESNIIFQNIATSIFKLIFYFFKRGRPPVILMTLG